MNPYIGDRQLDPPEEQDVCETCGGHGQYQAFVGTQGDWDVFDCQDCNPECDPGEPNDYPE